MPNQLDPQIKIGVVGVSLDELKYGHRIFRDLVNTGLENVYGVNPKGGEVAGVELLKSVQELPESLDVLICVLPAEITLSMLADITARKPKLIWLQPGAESSELVAAIEETHIPCKYDICFMKEYGIW